MTVSPKKFVFARHGVTDWNLERRYLGHTDQPLNELGKNQAKELGNDLINSLFDFDSIYSSDLLRAYETAYEIQKTINDITGRWLRIVEDVRLREMDFGWIEGFTYEEALATFPEEVTRWYEQPETLPPPGGKESLCQVRSRVSSFMKEVSKQGYDCILIVSHGGAINSWLSHVGKKPFWEMSLGHGKWVEFESQEMNKSE